MWAGRHRGILALLWVHAAAIFAYAFSLDGDLGHATREAGVISLAAALATFGPLGQRTRSAIASLGLLTCSAVLVHLSGGYIEMHFHFFVMVVVISLYQDWVPFLVAIGYVVLHHGVVGVLDPRAVYNHFDAWVNPWKWALIHGVFVLGASVASMVNWRLAEASRARAREAGRARMQERTARAAAEARVAARDEFLSVAAHELKTPVTGLLGFSELALLEIEKSQATPELSRALEVIQNQSTKLSGLVTQVMDISRIEAGKMTLNLHPVDVVRLAHDTVRAAQATTRNHVIHVTGPASVEAQIDALRLEQVLANLIGNAIKFSPSGGDIEVAIQSRSQDRVAISVTDHGIGIPPEHRAGIFDRFHQAHAGEFYGGMGLGLFISHQIVEMHGGRLDAEFPAVGGTRFIVDLPTHQTSELERVA